MIAVEGFAGRKAAVFGLGGSGLVTAHALAAGGAEIVVWDDKREKVDDAWNAGLPTGDLRVADFAAFDALVLAPGVPLTHPAPHWTVERARAAGTLIVGDVELFDRERRARLPGLKLAAITGTNGKSTTTALLGHLLKALGDDAEVGGNIGRPVLDLSPEPGVAVVEVSSYQIDLAPTVTPDVGALLNVTPDHIDRHGSFEAYAAVKERLVAASRQAVIGVDDETSAAVARRLAAAGKPVRRIGVFASERDLDRLDGAGVGAVGATLHVVENGAARPVGSLAGIGSLRGTHNAQNAAAAVALAMALGHAAEAAVAHLSTFPGLPHRMEEVGRDGAVLFVNDSKATNAQSTRQALAAFDRVHWIAGGVPKAGGIAGLADLFPRVVRAYLIGEAAPTFGETLAGRVEQRQCGTLEAALDAAATAAAREGGVVLLSPACASFDQFRSFEHRGDTFRALVIERLENERLKKGESVAC